MVDTLTCNAKNYKKKQKKQNIQHKKMLSSCSYPGCKPNICNQTENIRRAKVDQREQGLKVTGKQSTSGRCTCIFYQKIKPKTADHMQIITLTTTGQMRNTALLIGRRSTYVIGVHQSLFKRE